MSQDSGPGLLPEIGPPQERLTLGQMLLPEPERREDNRYDYTFIFNPGSIYQKIRTADNADDIEDLLFLMKLRRSCLEIAPVAYVIEKLLQGLLDPQLTRKFASRLQGQVAQKILISTSSDYIKEYRRQLGRMAIDVFFDRVFDLDKQSLWWHFARPRYGFEWVELESQHRQKADIREYELAPHSLLIFLKFFAQCNEKTKEGFKGKIRKFLECVLKEPLVVASPEECACCGHLPLGKRLHPNPKTEALPTVSGAQVGWTRNSRHELAKALVANGMYEECLEYKLDEAYEILVWKFLGERSYDIDGRSADKNDYSPEQAVKKACSDKEWAHIWSVITRMAYKQEKAGLVRITDANDPGITAGHTNVPLRLAFVFKNGLTRGLEGF